MPLVIFWGQSVVSGLYVSLYLVSNIIKNKSTESELETRAGRQVQLMVKCHYYYYYYYGLL